MTDSHSILDEWLIEGGVGDPPREVAVHAAVCTSCARRLGAFDSLSAVDVGAAGSPPPLPVPSRLAVGLAWARIGTALAGTVVAGILVVFGASQLVGWAGTLDLGPGPSQVAGIVFTPGPSPQPGTINPDPAVEPSFTPEPAGTPIPSFIPLPSLAPNEEPPEPPSAPFLSLNSVSQTTISISWTPGFGGGTVQKWEVWRRNGSGAWFKLGELLPGFTSLTNSGLVPKSTYSFMVRGVNVEWLGPYSNVITATTLAPPATPSPPPPPSATPVPTPPPQCADGVDNDGDGFVDGADPQCALGTTEAPFDITGCNDTLDNDGDGLADLADPGCSGLTDGDEHDPGLVCDNGLDDDGDTLSDFPTDPGCTAPTDSDETDPSPTLLPIATLLWGLQVLWRQSPAWRRWVLRISS